MSWFSKSCLFLTPVIFTANAMAARVQFHGEGLNASLKAIPVRSNAKVAPVEIRLSVPGINLDRVEDGFSSVSVEGLTPMVNEGNPELFTSGTLVAVPQGFEPELQILQQEQREVNGVVVRPAQKKFRCETGHRGFEFNSQLYQSERTFPSQVASLEEVGYLQNVRLVRVALNPMQMDMRNRSLRVTTQLVARVNFRQVANSAPVKLSPALYQVVRNVTANGRNLGTEILLSRAPEKMIAIVADSLKAEVEPYFAWKRSKGIAVEVYTFTEAGGSKEKVKEHIQKLYDAAEVKPTYLFFVGNKTSMPVFMESTGSGSAASDYRYALLSGTDAIPDALYGRILADDATDVAHQVKRMIQYEKSPEKNGTWYPVAHTLASNEGSGPSDKEYGEQVAAALKAGTYTKIHAGVQGQVESEPETIVGKVNEGLSWISYFGHGSGTSWGSTTGSFSNSNVAQLKNVDKLPIIIDVACLNAAWTNIAKPFGKAWVTHSVDGKEAGAAAFYGGSVAISWHPPAVMSVGISKYHFEKPVFTLGGSTLAGQLYLIEKMGSGSSSIDNVKWYNLFGDPAALIRTATPKAYQLKHQSVFENGRQIVTVTAVDEAGQGVAGLTTSLSKDGAETLAVGQTDTEGKAILSIADLGSLAGAVITTTGYNAETSEVVLQ